LCKVCNINAVKYRCPRCRTQSCSVACIKTHKKESGCDGRPVGSKFEKVAEMTDSTIQHDFRFLERALRQKDANWRFLALPDKCQLNAHCQLQAASRCKGINLQLLPFGMQRRGWNTTTLVDFTPNRRKRFRFKGFEVAWMLEMRFTTSSEPLVVYAEGVRESTDLAAVLRCPRLFLPDDLPRSHVLKISPLPDGAWDQLPDARDTAPLFVHQQIALLLSQPHAVVLQVQGIPGSPRYVEVDKDLKLCAALGRAGLIVEWPVLHIIPADQLGAQFPLVDESTRKHAATFMITPVAGLPVPPEEAEGDDEEEPAEAPEPEAGAGKGKGKGEGPKGRCLNCGGAHPLRKCRRRIVCRYCKKEGHTSNICYANPEALSRLCPRCGYRGHEVQDCSMYRPIGRRKKRDGQEGEDSEEEEDRRCDNCGTWDHRVEECSHDVRCIACQEDGHTYRQCPAHPTPDATENPRTHYGDQNDKLEALRFIVLPARVRDLKQKTWASAVLFGEVDAEGLLQPTGEELTDGDAVLTASHRYLIQRMEGPRQRKCLNCGDPSHMLRECPKEVVCENCYRHGHVKETCRDKVYAEGEERPGQCRNCGSREHRLWDCPEDVKCKAWFSQCPGRSCVAFRSQQKNSQKRKLISMTMSATADPFI